MSNTTNLNLTKVNGTDAKSDFPSTYNANLDKVDAMAVDYIVEQGTSGTWTYRKWNSGIAECWSFTTTPIEASSSASGSVYYGDSSAISFPITFTAVPSITISMTQTGSTTAWPVVVYMSTTSFIIRVFRGAAVTTANYRFSAHAFGRWK
ncbi:MAG: hypothetical protein MJZ37_06250 [Bacilli bacterium]|nr:hypothetical protein [Bacilli bacterium]